MGKALPCARNIAHGKGSLCRWLFAMCPLPCAAHGKAFAMGFSGFAVCFGHTANKASPIVTRPSVRLAPPRFVSLPLANNSHPIDVSSLREVICKQRDPPVIGPLPYAHRQSAESDRHPSDRRVRRFSGSLQHSRIPSRPATLPPSQSPTINIPCSRQQQLSCKDGKWIAGIQII